MEMQSRDHICIWPREDKTSLAIVPVILFFFPFFFASICCFRPRVLVLLRRDLIIGQKGAVERR